MNLSTRVYLWLTLTIWIAGSAFAIWRLGWWGMAFIPLLFVLVALPPFLRGLLNIR